MRVLLLCAAMLAGCTSTAVVPPLDSAVSGPVVEGKLADSTDLTYIPFTNTGDSPVIATKQYVDQKSGSGWTVYKTYGGELYNDSRMFDVILVDGSKDFDITATLSFTGKEYKRFYFVNLSEKYDIHLYMGSGPAYVVGGPMSTSLIIANDTDFQVVTNSPAYVPSVVKN